MALEWGVKQMVGCSDTDVEHMDKNIMYVPFWSSILIF
jgi:hypothetical protein